MPILGDAVVGRDRIAEWRGSRWRHRDDVQTILVKYVSGVCSYHDRKAADGAIVVELGCHGRTESHIGWLDNILDSEFS